MDTATPAVKKLNGLHLPHDIVPDHAVDHPPVEVLLNELPFVSDGQVSLGELVARVVQSIYAELNELAETMPNMSDAARKRTLADWVVKTKKNVAKIYAVVKWSRDAESVQRSMNIVAFIMGQSQQFLEAITGVDEVRTSLDGARMRNHDILTSLDVLTTGTYQRLPSIIKSIIPPKPLTDAQVAKTLSDIEGVMRYRLRLHELIPVDMAQYVISEGRVHFTAPRLFKASLCLTGAQRTDGWFFQDVEFLFNVGGQEATQEFPRTPTGVLQRFITDEVDARLGLYVPPPLPPPLPPGVEMPPEPERPKPPEGTVDAPLVRLFNFLQTMSLSYQLEVLCYQAQRMRSLGWANHFSAKMSPDRQSLLTQYWIRPPPPPPNTKPSQNPTLPLFAGSLKISIVPASESISSSKLKNSSAIHAAYRAKMTPQARILSELQQNAKLGQSKPSDEVEKLCFRVEWETSKGAFGIPNITPEQLSFDTDDALDIISEDLDFESLLRKILDKHIRALLLALQFQIQQFQVQHVFTRPGVIRFISEGDFHALHVRISPTEVVIVTIDPRTGRLTLRDTGDLAAAGRGPRFTALSDKLNDHPSFLGSSLFSLRQNAIIEIVEQKAMYLGLQCYRKRNLSREEMAKFGPNLRTQIFISLAMFENHYLVIVADDQQFRFALIWCKVASESPYTSLTVQDIAWLDFERIRAAQDFGRSPTEEKAENAMKRKRDGNDDDGTDVFSKFVLETGQLRELYNYCCARVAFMKVETQLKQLSIQFSYVSPTNLADLVPELSHVQSSLARSVPSLCVASRQLLAGAPAAEAAMPNVRIIPLNWWTDKGLQILTCIKLKYVQQPMGKTASGSGSTVIRPSQRIIYDTQEAVVSFLCDNVDGLLKEIQDEWARVSQMVVIAREVARMTEIEDWSDVQLLTFDLQTVEFVYAQDYTVTIAYENPDDFTSSRFHLRFSRVKSKGTVDPNDMDVDMAKNNPHADSEPFLKNILIRGHGRLASSVHRLVSILRDTLPMLEELERSSDAWNSQSTRTLNSIIDTIPKAAGWYRMVYGDSRHALDFRLMTESRMAIIDASHSLSQDASSTNLPVDSKLGLQPIPGLSDITTNAAQDLLKSGQVRPHSIVSIGVGLICSASSAPCVIRAVHHLVAQKILSS